MTSLLNLTQLSQLGQPLLTGLRLARYPLATYIVLRGLWIASQQHLGNQIAAGFEAGAEQASREARKAALEQLKSARAELPLTAYVGEAGQVYSFKDDPLFHSDPLLTNRNESWENLKAKTRSALRDVDRSLSDAFDTALRGVSTFAGEVYAYPQERCRELWTKLVNKIYSTSSGMSYDSKLREQLRAQETAIYRAEKTKAVGFSESVDEVMRVLEIFETQLNDTDQLTIQGDEIDRCWEQLTASRNILGTSVGKHTEEGSLRSRIHKYITEVVEPNLEYFQLHMWDLDKEIAYLKGEPLDRTAMDWVCARLEGIGRTIHIATSYKRTEKGSDTEPIAGPQGLISELREQLRLSGFDGWEKQLREAVYAEAQRIRKAPGAESLQNLHDLESYDLRSSPATQLRKTLAQKKERCLPSGILKKPKQRAEMRSALLALKAKSAELERYSVTAHPEAAAKAQELGQQLDELQAELEAKVAADETTPIAVRVKPFPVAPILWGAAGGALLVLTPNLLALIERLPAIVMRKF